MNSIQLKAMGKINLGLDVVRRRPDGYHEVKMVMQTVNLYDKVRITVEDEPGIRVTANLSFLPVNENNIVYKAAAMMRELYHIEKGIAIDLEKHIPVAAGMAGGSTDGAAVLYGMNRLFDLKLSRNKLMELGVKLGADVPYCLLRGTALSEGIGEVLTPLPGMPDCWILIARPPVSVSTKFVYENLHLETIEKHPDIDGIVDAIRRSDLYGMCSRLDNVLETVTVVHHPEIEEIKCFMKDHGAVNAIMSGSGPTVFGIYDDENKAKAACAGVKDSGMARQVFLARPYNRSRADARAGQ